MKQTHINLRLPLPMIEQIERYREYLENTTGLPVNRSDAIRLLVKAGIDAKAKEMIQSE